MFRITTAALLISCASLSLAEEAKYNSAYARINVDAQISEEGEEQFTEVKSNNTWIGMKGNVPIEDTGLRVVYRLEWTVGINEADAGSNLTPRPQYVGIAGKAGQLHAGRDFTPVWGAVGGVDLFNHYEGDIKNLWEGENRLSSVIVYSSPKWNNVSAKVLYEAEREAGGDSATSASVSYGDKSFKHSRFFAAIGHDFDLDGHDLTRAAFQYKMDAHKIGVAVQQQKDSRVEDAETEFGTLLSYSYFDGTLDYRFQYQTMEDNSGISVGIDYPIAKMTKLFTWFTTFDKNEEDSNYLAFGIEHRFSRGF